MTHTPDRRGDAVPNRLPPPGQWFFRRPPAVAALLAAAAAALAAPDGGPEGPARLGPEGLASFVVGGQELLHSGRPEVGEVVFEETFRGDKGFREYKFEKASVKPARTEFDRAARRLTYAYPWGALEVAYTPGPGRLDLAVTVRNDSPRTLASFDVTLLRLELPETPAGWKPGQPVLRNSLDDLALVEARLPSGTLLACNRTLDPPFHFGFARPGGKGGRVYPLVLRGGVNATEPGAYVLEPRGLPRVPPGKGLTLAVTLRAAAAGAAPGEVLADVYEAFRAAHRPFLKWEDRRPIAMITLASGSKGHATRTNPRGWMNDPRLDVTTPGGRADFRRKMLEGARKAAQVIRDTGGQGMIFWDVEGQENPHPVTYIGDPKLAARLAPEMDAIADDYFRVFRDAGLRTGVCLRPTQPYYDEAQKKWAHGTGSDGGPGRGDYYPQLRPKDVPWFRFYPVAERLADKIAYAKKRWGCTLFYVDTNGTYKQMGEDQKFRWQLLDAATWKRVRDLHPDVLLVPELAQDDFTFHAAEWAYTAPYMELKMKRYGTPAKVRDLLPGAFSVVNVNDGDFAGSRDALKASVARGDILMFRGWFADPRNPAVRALYEEAKGR